MQRTGYARLFFAPLLLISVMTVIVNGQQSDKQNQDKPATKHTYLKPGTPEVGGIHHLCLIYHGQKRRVAWTRDALLPYVAYVDPQGMPKDWLFDSFLMIEFATDRGVSLYHDAPKAAKPTADDWVWLADCWFREKTGLVGLEEAVAEAGRVLGEPDRKVNVMITMPLPQKSIRKFGPLPGQDRVLDFSKESDRHQALQWYVDRVLGNYGKREYPHLRLLGFYWTQESIPESDYDTVARMAEHLHKRGQKFYWIPYFYAKGFDAWKRLGFDAVMLQPNHFFHKNSKTSKLMHTAWRAQIGGSGVEMELDGRMMAKGPDRDLFVDHFYDYLDAGVKYGWMTGSVLGWYEGGGTIKRFIDNPQTGRKYYDDVYRFVKGTYKPTDRDNLPKLTVVHRDNSKNLALGTQGAKISGCVDNPDEPGLAPQKILDGEIHAYGGRSGFGYTHIPGSFTVELPKTSTVARTQTMLFALDDRFFRYRIETSQDGKTWQPAVDKSKGQWSGWQVDRFDPRQARYVRFTALHNSLGQNLCQVVEFEVYEE